ncbi:hypothetical protein JOM56_014419 [Amanita muscaria]
MVSDISEEEFSIAALQGYLLRNKYYPEAAADGVMDWVKSEHEVRKVEAREGGKRQPTAHSPLTVSVGTVLDSSEAIIIVVTGLRKVPTLSRRGTHSLGMGIHGFLIE